MSAVHRVRWFVWAGDVKIPRTSTMRGQWGYDVTCSCGWETRTGGAVRSYIEHEVWAHKLEHGLHPWQSTTETTEEEVTR